MNTPSLSLFRALAQDELFDLTLYRALRRFADADTSALLDALIAVEFAHLAFWQERAGAPESTLSFTQRIKLNFLVAFCRLFRTGAIRLILQSIEIYGITKYLDVWEQHKDDRAMHDALTAILQDEFEHEERIVSKTPQRKVHPVQIRDIFLGFNDGLIEIIGAASGFFAAFHTTSSVVVAGFAVAVAGSISMGAGAYAATSSEAEVREIERRKELFLNHPVDAQIAIHPFLSASNVGVSYFIGAAIPLLPILFGAQTLIFPILLGALLAIFVSWVLAFLSGMHAQERVRLNLTIIAIAVAASYALGLAAKLIWGIQI